MTNILELQSKMTLIIPWFLSVFFSLIIFVMCLNLSMSVCWCLPELMFSMCNEVGECVWIRIAESLLKGRGETELVQGGSLQWCGVLTAEGQNKQYECWPQYSPSYLPEPSAGLFIIIRCNNAQILILQTTTWVSVKNYWKNDVSK